VRHRRPLVTIVIAMGALLSSAAVARRPAAPKTAVALETEAGVIVIAIQAKEAPASSGAFLAQVRGGRYDGGSFFRTVRPDTDTSQIPIRVIQGGTRDDGVPLAEAPIAHEDTRRTGLTHVDGAVSLPRAGIGTTTATSFFVSVGAQPALDFGGMRNPDGQGFAVFGKVICGMDVVRAIQSRPTSASSPSPAMQGQILEAPVRILRARITQPRCAKRG
jgi:peptidyl-prolyl cis-trans isomerase A (cyclophilin A)